MRILNTAKITSTQLNTKVSKSGDTVTGPLVLQYTPTQPTHAITKQYVDDSVAGVSSQLNTKVSKSGDTVTGPLVLQYTPTQPTHAITKQYADNLVATTAVSGISLTGPGVVNPSQQATYTITNFDSFSVYTVAVSAGTVSRSNETITVTAPSSGTGFTLTITKDGKQSVYSIALNQASVATPSITSPSDGAIDIALKPTFTSSAFTAHGGNQTHVASEWQIASDSSFTSIVQQSGETTTSLTSWTPANELSKDTTYYVRVRHKGSVTGWSSWSSSVSFKTVKFFNSATFYQDTSANAYYVVFRGLGIHNDYRIISGFLTSDPTNINNTGRGIAVINTNDNRTVYKSSITPLYYTNAEVDNEGSNYLLGSYYTYNSTNNYYKPNIAIAKVDQSAQVLWSKRISPNSSWFSVSGCVRFNPYNNHIYVCGVFEEVNDNGDSLLKGCLIKIDKSGNVVKTLYMPEPVYDITFLKDGKIAMVTNDGDIDNINPSYTISRIIVLDQNEALVKAVVLNTGSYHNRLNGITTDGTDIYVCGRLYTYNSSVGRCYPYNPIVAKLSSSLVLTWATSITSTSDYAYLYNVAYYNDKIYVTGEYPGSSRDALVSVFDKTTGSKIKAYVFANKTTTVDDLFTDIVAASGGVYINGSAGKKGIFVGLSDTLDLATGSTVSEFNVSEDNRTYSNYTFSFYSYTPTITTVTPYITNLSYTLTQDTAINNITYML